MNSRRWLEVEHGHGLEVRLRIVDERIGARLVGFLALRLRLPGPDADVRPSRLGSYRQPRDRPQVGSVTRRQTILKPEEQGIDPELMHTVPAPIAGPVV